MNMSALGSVTIAAHDAVVPLVVRYFPELPVCDGRLTGAAAHCKPRVAVDAAVSKYPSVPIGNLAAKSGALPTTKSPFASIRF
jgi:hypothetical protein